MRTITGDKPFKRNSLWRITNVYYSKYSFAKQLWLVINIVIITLVILLTRELHYLLPLVLTILPYTWMIA